jgi:ribosomal protein S18 acetylase RimI-like enzyme
MIDVNREDPMSGVRTARTGDAEAIAAIEVETWQMAYAGLLPDQMLLALSVSRRSKIWAEQLLRADHGILVWDQSDEGIQGYAQYGRQRDLSQPYEGEVFTLYVHPDAQSVGIGRQLLLASLGGLLARDMRSALTWVLEANPARFFYERMGAKLVSSRSFTFGDQTVDALGYGWSDLSDVLNYWVRSGDGWAP